jgi:predicted nucleic acid-binding protein
VIVVDASVLVDFLLGRQAAVEGVREHVCPAAHVPLGAPDLIYLETLNALRRLVHRGHLSESRGAAAVEDLARTRLAAYPHAPLCRRVWELRHTLTAYDASYLALAELLEGSVLLTVDAALAAAAREHLGGDRVHAIEA